MPTCKQSLTATSSVATLLAGGLALLVAQRLIEYVRLPWSHEGVHLKIPLVRFILAPAGAEASKLQKKGALLLVALIQLVTDTVCPSTMNLGTTGQIAGPAMR
jgi:hypothetical protein